MSSNYLAKQLSGPLAQGTMQTVEDQYALSDPIISYWYGLNIDNAASAELTAIGYLVGLPWPSAPLGTFDTNSFIIGTSASYPQSSYRGLSGVGLLTGGPLASDATSTAGLMPITSYRILLKAFAYLKWYGLSWVSIDKIAASFGTLNYAYRPGNYNQFTLGTSATYPVTDTAHGLSGVGLTTGGFLSSTDPSYFPDSDIIISYITPLSLANLWIIQALFKAVCTAPQVFVRNGA